MACVAIVIVGAFNFGLGFVQNIIVQVLAASNAEQAIVFVVQFTLSVLGWIVQIWLTIGQTMVMLDIARGREVNLGKIFGGAPLLLKTILAIVIISLALHCLRVSGHGTQSPHARS